MLLLSPPKTPAQPTQPRGQPTSWESAVQPARASSACSRVLQLASQPTQYPPRPASLRRAPLPPTHARMIITCHLWASQACGRRAQSLPSSESESSCWPPSQLLGLFFCRPLVFTQHTCPWTAVIAAPAKEGFHTHTVAQQEKLAKGLHTPELKQSTWVMSFTQCSLCALQ